MTYHKLLHHQIFPIPVGSHYGMKEDTLYLVYSPLAGCMLIATPDSVDALNSALDAPEGSTSDIKEAIALLSNYSPIEKRIRKINGTDDLQKMSILPNHKCNLSCTYCYASQGRTGEELDKEQLKAGLVYFIDPKRLKNRFLTISFIGGGEPLLSWDIVRYGIEYAHKLAVEGAFTLSITLITNGTIMNDEIAATLKQYNVLPDISFDILKDTQDKQRGQYETICQTLDMLDNYGLRPSVNATITPHNVKLQEHMATEMLNRFPHVDNMIFEPVVSTAFFSNLTDFKQFYKDYHKHFMAAQKLAEAAGKKIESRLSRNLNDIIDRGCPSKFSLTPQGDITICYCSSSPKEKDYEKRVYGNIDKAASLALNQDKFLTVHNENVYSFDKCKDCFAKWHCGGGCMCPNSTYSEEYLNVICDFTCNYIKQVLLERMDSEGVMDKYKMNS